MEIRRAAREELEAVDVLLREAGLPLLPPAQPLSNLLVARQDGRVVGAIALEVAGRKGLLRSAVVAPAQRRQGMGSHLLSSIVSRAHELGLRDLYLLTETARDFFAGRGFVEVTREDVPPEIRATREFAEVCPQTAVVMCQPLSTRL